MVHGCGSVDDCDLHGPLLGLRLMGHEKGIGDYGGFSAPCEEHSSKTDAPAEKKRTIQASSRDDQ